MHFPVLKSRGAMILLLLFVFFRLDAQQVTGLRHYGVESGLSIGSVLCLEQDRQGFTWIGTSNGLDRFDGYTFREFQNDPRDTNSLLSNTVLALALDSSGKLWIATAKGINIYDPQRDQLSRWRKWDEASRGKKTEISCLKFITGGSLAIASSLGLTVIDTASGKCMQFFGMKEHAPDSLQKEITVVFESSAHSIWLGSAGGELYRWEKGKDEPVYRSRVVCDKNTKDGSGISAIAERGNSILMMATGCGVRFYNMAANSFVNYFRDNAFADTLCNCQFHDLVKVDEDHYYVLNARRMEELDFSRHKINTLVNNTHDNDNLFTTGQKMIRDRQGIIWVGDYGKGLYCFKPDAAKIYTITASGDNPDHLVNPFVFAFCEKGDTVFVGSNWGIDMVDLKNDRIRNVVLVPGKKPENYPVAVQNIVPGDSDDIWFLARWSISGLVHWHYRSGEMKVYGKEDGFTSPRYSCLLRRKGGILWAGSRTEGIVIFDPSKGKVIARMKNDSVNPNTISANSVSCLYEDAQGGVWVGTRAGLNYLEPVTYRVKRFKMDLSDSASLSSDHIYCVTGGLDGTIWAGTDNGFVRYDKAGGHFKSYTKRNGLPDNFINSIIPDSAGSLWISTNKGLCRFDPKKETFKNYGMEDGLQDLEFNVGAGFYGRSGKIYFGGVNGCNYFDPHQITANQYVPPVYITGIRVFNHVLASDSNFIFKKSISLPYDQNFLSFEFVGLNFLMPGKNRYSCMLEGVDKNWVDLGDKRSVSYSDLSPGEYVLRIRASNNDGVWNEQGASLRIEIRPPFYKTKWFYFLCMALGFGGAWNYVRGREKKLVAEKKILESKVEERTQELKIEKEKVVAAHQDIKDSIHYAKRIQSTILPGEEEWNQLLPDSFVLYGPRDVVSGDFFWIAEAAEKIYIAAADCTGHGVPGAFMSMIGHTQLNDIVKQEKITDTGRVLDRLHLKVSAALKQDMGSGARDGMDIALIAMDKKTRTLQYSGANRSLLLVRGGVGEEIRADKFPIGGGADTGERHFNSVQLEMKAGDMVYLFSDGYGDQFGGPKGKKFGSKQLREKLAEVSVLAPAQQKKEMERTFNNWKGDIEQVDDVLLIGIRL